jgi:hypothetical protein
MGLVRFVFCITSMLFGINVLLIALGEFGIKYFKKNLDIYYFTGSIFGIALLVITIWGVFTL